MRMNMNLDKYWKLLLVANVTYLLYVIILSYFNMPVSDDWVFFNSVDEKGIWEFQKEIYMTWQGRFSMFFMTSVYLYIYKLFGTVFFVSILNYSVGVISIYLLLKLFIPKLEVLKKLIVSLLAINIVLVSSMSYHTFFWICASSYYLISFLTVILAYLILKKGYSIMDIILIIVFSILISGSAEHYVPMVMLSGGIYYIYLVKSSLRGKGDIKKKLLLSLIILFVGFVIMVIAPGNYVRISVFERPDTIISWCFAIVKSYALLFPALVPSIIEMSIVFIPSILIGKELKCRGIKMNVIFDKRSMLVTFIGLIIIYMIGILPGTCATATLAPLRAFSYFSVIGVLFFMYWGIALGYSYRVEGYMGLKGMNSAIIVFSILFFIYSIGKIVTDFPRVLDYKESLDERKAYIEEKRAVNNDGQPYLFLSPLRIDSYQTPELWFYNRFMYLSKSLGLSGRKDLPVRFFPLPTDEIGTAVGYNYSNRALKTFYKLDFGIIKESKD